MGEPSAHSPAEGLKPSADVYLRMCLAAVVAGAGGIGSFFRPPDDLELRLTAVDDKPAYGMLRFFSTDFASIHCFNHTDLRLLFPTIRCMAPEGNITPASGDRGAARAGSPLTACFQAHAAEQMTCTAPRLRQRARRAGDNPPSAR